MNNKNLGIGILVGLAVGVAAGLLYAPQSGRETRAQIGEKMDDFKEKVGEMTAKVKGKLAQVRGDGHENEIPCM